MFIFFRPLFTEIYSFNQPNNCDTSGEINMEICIIGKSRKLNSYKTVSQFSTEPVFKCFFYYDKIQ